MSTVACRLELADELTPREPPPVGANAFFVDPKNLLCHLSAFLPSHRTADRRNVSFDTGRSPLAHHALCLRPRGSAARCQSREPQRDDTLRLKSELSGITRQQKPRLPRVLRGSRSPSSRHTAPTAPPCFAKSPDLTRSRLLGHIATLAGVPSELVQ